jgi:hypothetical protein
MDQFFALAQPAGHALRVPGFGRFCWSGINDIGGMAAMNGI